MFDGLKVKEEGNAGGAARSRHLSDKSETGIFGLVENNAKVDLRLPSGLRSALERERKRMSKETKTEVKMSAVVRAILEKALKPKPQRERAA